MSKWDKFEIDCVNYLNEIYNKHAKFIKQGGNDSTVPDILVRSYNGNEFYIEAKHSPAQSGQFVLLPNQKTMKFDYSSRNIYSSNESARLIINEMNKNFEAFRDSGTAGRKIVFDNSQKVFSDWIIDFYKNKGVDFVITNGFKIFPIQNFPLVFDIECKFRVKRSGSSSVGRNNLINVINYITTNFSVSNVKEENDKLFIYSSIELHNKRFVLGEYEYMFSYRDGKYEIRRLSNTFNANVIFSIVLNPKCDTCFLDFDDFVKYL